MKIITKILLVVLTLSSFIACSQSKKKVASEKEPSKAMTVSNKAKIIKTDAEWKETLSPQQYFVLREKGTERPHTSPLLKNKKDGIYYCSACQNPLFDAGTKFKSGTGWPSFWKPLFDNSVAINRDVSHGMVREEVVCARCDGHLGHVFNDGPEPTGLRYCMNGVSLEFAEKADEAKAVFAQGCFWCVEEIFESVKGVGEVVSGYAGGEAKNPTYKDMADHAESVSVKYDPKVISYEDLLKVYFNSGDITQVMGQGPDKGSHYRSIVFYSNEVEKEQILNYIKRLNDSGKYNSKIAVDVEPLDVFYAAEGYHQDFAKLNPNQGYVKAVSIPRFKKAIKKFPELLKNNVEHAMKP